MPQASEEQRREWNGPMDHTAVKFLEDAGFFLTGDFKWRLPKPDHVPTEREASAIQFLIDEWDYGDIEISDYQR